MKTVEPGKPIAEKLFPKTLDAIYWAMKKYGDEEIYRLELKAIIGEGTKAIIFMREPSLDEEPVVVTQKKPAAKKVKKNARSAKKS